jgi:hypothetical protein
MKTQRLSAATGQGPIVCIIIDSNPGTIDKDDNERDREEQQINQTGVSDDTIPAGEEQNMPDPEEYEERQGDEDLNDIPMEEPVPDIDEIEKDDIDDLDLDEDEEVQDPLEDDIQNDEII